MYFLLSSFLRRSCHVGISLRNSGLLSAAVFVSQAYPSSGFADSKPRIRGMYPGNLLSACLLYAPDQCDWVPQASPVGAPCSAIVNPCFLAGLRLSMPRFLCSWEISAIPCIWYTTIRLCFWTVWYLTFPPYPYYLLSD